MKSKEYLHPSDDRERRAAAVRVIAAIYQELLPHSEWTRLFFDIYSDDRERRAAAVRVIAATYSRGITATEYVAVDGIEPYAAVDQDGRPGTVWCQEAQVQKGYWDFQSPIWTCRPEELSSSDSFVVLIENDEDWEVRLVKGMQFPPIDGVFCPD